MRAFRPAGPKRLLAAIADATPASAAKLLDSARAAGVLANAELTDARILIERSASQPSACDADRTVTRIYAQAATAIILTHAGRA
jgi:hypothetical protein